MKALLISLLIAGALLSGCAGKTRGVVAVLPLPPELVMPITHRLSPEQDDHLFDEHQDIYDVIGWREDLYLKRIETLKGIIRTTH